MSELVIDNLSVTVGDKQILNGFTLTVPAGEVHEVMGPNGSGKSTLAHALSARPGYRITGGSILLDGFELVNETASQRARRGLFLALQQPIEVPGVRLRDMLGASGAEIVDLDLRLENEAARVGLRHDLLERFINVDLSGGERKRAEIVQLALLRPKFAVLDEIDSGLDVDALREVSRRLQSATTEWDCGVLAITHFQRLLNELTPTAIHVMDQGRLVASGGPELARELEKSGYEPFRVTTK